MTHHVWRLSGKDGQAHAFSTDGGYLPPQDVISAVPLGSAECQDAEESFGPYEAFSTACRQLVPIAMLLPLAGNNTCPSCMDRTETTPWTTFGVESATSRRTLVVVPDPGL